MDLEYKKEAAGVLEKNKLLFFINECLEKLIKDKDSIQKLIKEKRKESKRILYRLERIKQKIRPMQNVFSPGDKELENEKLELEQQYTIIVKEIEQYREKEQKIISSYENMREIRSCITTKISSTENSKVDFSNITTNNEELGLELLQIQELERSRIARELHDTTVQNLTNLVHKTELCSKLVSIDTVRVNLELQTMAESIRGIINDMRAIIYDLKPMSIEDLGLITTIEHFVQQLMINYEIKVLFKKEGVEPKILPVVKLSIFRIVQEACNNTIKHANATLICIYLECKAEEIVLSIKDDGCGFDKEKIEKVSSSHKSGFGLSIMEERTCLLGGKMDINTAIGNGTLIKVILPINGLMEG